MSFKVKDGISPELKKMTSKFRNRKPILTAMGAALKSVTMEAFRNPSVRMAAWKPTKKDTGRQILIQSGRLARSVRIVNVSNSSVEVGLDPIYAAIHQFGGQAGRGRKVTIPARPFIPFDSSGKMSDVGKRRVERAATAKIKALMPPGTR